MPRKKIIEQMSVSVYNITGKAIGRISLPQDIFGVAANASLLAQASRVCLANQRSGTHSSKTRSEVVSSTRKIYRQKGTGRARHGDIKAPIFIGGGVAHGPHPKDYSLTLPKKMKKLALFMSLSDKHKEGNLKVIVGLEKIEAKTKRMVEVLNNLELITGKSPMRDKILLIVLSKIKNIDFSGRNLSYLTITEARMLNAYNVLNHKKLLFTKDAVTSLSDIFIGRSKEKIPNIVSIEKKKNDTSYCEKKAKKKSEEDEDNNKKIDKIVDTRQERKIENHEY